MILKSFAGKIMQLAGGEKHWHVCIGKLAVV